IEVFNRLREAGGAAPGDGESCDRLRSRGPERGSPEMTGSTHSFAAGICTAISHRSRLLAAWRERCRVSMAGDWLSAKRSQDGRFKGRSDARRHPLRSTVCRTPPESRLERLNRSAESVFTQRRQQLFTTSPTTWQSAPCDPRSDRSEYSR